MPSLSFLRRERGALRISLALGAAVAAISLGVMVLLPGGGSAAGGDFSLDFIAAGDETYNHLTTPANETDAGGLQYDSRDINEFVVEQLESEDFACGDTIVFFTQVTTDAGASSTQSIDITYDFDAQNNGQTGVGYSDIVAVGISDKDFAGQTAESGNKNLEGDETATLVSKTYTPGNTTPPNAQFGTANALHTIGVVRVTGLNASDVVIVRVDVRFSCFATPVTGNLHAALKSAKVTGSTARTGVISVGQQDIPMLHLGTTPTPTNTPVPSPTPGITRTPSITRTTVSTTTAVSTTAAP